jgi:alkylation response protein AidB-like acyl-CoA dehydrogenase
MTAPSSATLDLTAAGRLNSRLDEAAVNGGPFSPSYSARKDRTEEFPAEAVRVLDDFGLSQWFVPRELGGRLQSVPELMRLLRVVSRRDLTVAIAYGKTFLGTVPVWVGGSPEQKSRLAEQVCGDSAMVTWALTERHHGADLMAGEVSAERTAEGWRLRGAKWLINNATRALLVTLLARTDPAGGARGFSLFLVDKRSLPPGSFVCLPKERTHGIRGADISGIDFRDAVAPADALVAHPGDGLETVLKSLQITRTTCVALSVGAADHALRLAVDFTRRRTLYDRPLASLPNVRWQLGSVAATALLAEVAAEAGGRSVHALPLEMSVTAAITKALVPTLVDGLVSDVGELLGARGLLTEEYADGMFQKLERDHRIVGIFDGSSTVNRNALINQFPMLARAYRQGNRYDQAGLEATLDLTAPLTALPTAGLSLVSRTGCSVIQSVPASLARMRALAAKGDVPQTVARLAERFGEAVAGVLADMATLRPAAREVPAEAFESAWQYELCFAGAACLGAWLHTDVAEAGALWRDGTWLAGCLARVLSLLGHEQEDDGAQAYSRLADVLLQTPQNGAFSVLADLEEAQDRS